MNNSNVMYTLDVYEPQHGTLNSPVYHSRIRSIGFYLQNIVIHWNGLMLVNISQIACLATYPQEASLQHKPLIKCNS